jgi:hypothetical protein
MSTIEKTPFAASPRNEPWQDPLADDPRFDHWNEWPVFWSAVWVGGLASLVAVLLCGLMGIAFGAHQVGPESRVVDLHNIGFWSIFCAVLSAFGAGMLGGWITGEIAGIQRAETGMYHGAISWLVATPLIVVLAALGAGSYLGGWYGGLAGTPAGAGQSEAPFLRPEPPMPDATAEEQATYMSQERVYRAKVQQWHKDAPLVARNSAITAASALLIGLVGSVIGGWLASGDSFPFTESARKKHATSATS